MISNIIGFFLIALTVIFFLVIAFALKKLFSSKIQNSISLSHALDKFFFEEGKPKYGTLHIERILIIHFLWILLGIITLFCFQTEFDFKSKPLLLTSIFSLFLGLWWGWRKGIFK